VIVGGTVSLVSSSPETFRNSVFVNVLLRLPASSSAPTEIRYSPLVSNAALPLTRNVPLYTSPPRDVRVTSWTPNGSAIAPVRLSPLASLMIARTSIRSPSETFPLPSPRSIAVAFSIVGGVVSPVSPSLVVFSVRKPVVSLASLPASSTATISIGYESSATALAASTRKVAL